uniref:Lipoprotein n=1 Tax=Sphingobacterium sp. (strain 21) TaxID=743722 RepID=F4C2C6_SPHS2
MKNLLLIVVVLSFSSCGLFKNTFRHKEVQSEVSKSTLSKSEDSTGLKIDRTVITETSEIDTSITIPGKTLSSQKKATKEELREGVLVVDSAGIKVKIMLDSANELIKALVQTDTAVFKVKKKNQRIEARDITEQSETKDKHEQERQVAIENKTGTVEKTPIKMGNLVAIVLGALFILGVFIWIYRRFKK